MIAAETHCWEIEKNSQIFNDDFYLETREEQGKNEKEGSREKEGWVNGGWRREKGERGIE
jgi:hypothetical protein